MRKIKFRMWGKEENRYLCFAPFPTILNTKDKTIELKDDNIILEQFTGLHDKNGKEIYEGDILQAISNNLVDTTNYRFKIYVGIDGAFRYEMQYNEGDKWERKANQTVNSLVSENTKKYYDVEIIGNIHEGDNND